jgi:type I restriction enzyme M protein
MPNERKTETIVRNHFGKYLKYIEVEEQKSDNAKINKLLKLASKKGNGQGYPEFLITYKNNSDLLIVIECKAKTSKHEHSNSVKDKYSEYAVDGVLLYSSFLSKDFDVLAIAISGESSRELKVSHFLQLKGEKQAVTLFGDKLLPAIDYLNGYLKSPEKFRQDYLTLLDFTKYLNEKLHSHKILENQRSLLISSILIALDNDAFKSSYQSHATPKNLANALIQTVSDELERANINGQKLENLNTQFGFIKTDISLSVKPKVLKELIDEIDENINQFIKTHEYFDVLGQLYIEFLRYANSDKGLGIVLTPPHITELFAELAQVNKNSVAFDNCTGTGGFLISAMKKMILDARGDERKIKQIKKSQLIGVEYQAHIYALAVSNMYIHQDGKTNIINGSCFDPNIIREVKSKKPTVGFLNPPYKSKKSDIEELDFVLNNLEILVDGGKCLAIVPMKIALETSGKILELKRKLLSKHTLDAVFSMPDELFFNSKVGVVSCIMAFTAHKPHPRNKETFFGYFKDDGFVKRKHKGRINLNGVWENIKHEWVNLYINKKNKPGVSINKIVNPEVEWCAEAYMQTNYDTLSEQEFIYSTLNYLSFLIKEGKFESYNDFISKMNPRLMQLDTKNWKYFELNELFSIKKGKRLTKADMNTGKTYFIGSSDSNNGLTAKIDVEPIFKANTLTVNYDGSVAEAYYQPEQYWALDSVNVLYPRFKLNPYIGLFIATIIRLEKYRFNYGRKWGKERMEKSKIKLPASNAGPDFQFMEAYIKALIITS